MINELTKKQEEYLPVFREEWLKVGLETKTIDKNKAKTAVKNLYAAAGLDEPEVLFFDSPLQCLFARIVLLSFGRGQLRGQLGGQLRDQLWGQLRDQLRDQLWDQLRDQLGDQLGDQLWDQAWQNPWFNGGQDAYWMAFYEFGREIGASYTNNNHLNAYIDYTKTCGWMFPYRGLAFVSDRPSEIHFSDEGLLHNENGPSVKFRDGFSVCSWRGIRVPNEWIENKDKLTPDIALTHHNVEQRRAACEIIGWSKILDELDAKTIDSHPNPLVGEVIEVSIPDIGRERFLKVMCGTKREFALPVPPDIERATQAQAWLNWESDESIFENMTVRT